MRRSVFLSMVLVGGLMAGCAGPAGAPSSSGPADEQARPSKTLVVVGRAEPPSLSSRAFRSLGLTPDLPTRIFNAHLTIRNDAGLPVPYLAEAVPQLNTDTWRVNPDGTMETRYRLKPNTTWHDGQPLTADDFVFAQEVFAEPALAANTLPPGSLIDRVVASDARTVVIYWKQTYPYADGTSALGGSGTSSGGGVLPPLPRHLLEQPFRTQDPEAFMAHAFWTREYVGAGPYKVDQWEFGAFLEAVAFDSHVLGKPRITRIRELFIPDPNTALANVLAGQAALTSGDSIRFTDGETLRQQWGERGQILNFPNLFRITAFQYRPEFASTEAFTDLRVRQALHYGIDFPTINEAIQGGRTTQATGPIPPTAGYYGDLARAVTHYPFEPRKTEQLMAEAGFARGADGVWVSPNPRYGRMAFETNVLANPDSEAEMHIMADTWRKLGFDVREAVLAPSLGADNVTLTSFSGVRTTSTPPGENRFSQFSLERIPRPENRWTGQNYGGWAGSPEFDRLVKVFETSLSRDERTQAVIQMNKILTDNCAEITLYWKLNAQAVADGLTGPRLTDPNGSADWNIHEWELR